MQISVERTGKNQLESGQEIIGMLQCCHVVLCLEILDRNLPVCWSNIVREEPTVGSFFIGVFPSF
jgi:hypothetical protein